MKKPVHSNLISIFSYPSDLLAMCTDHFITSISIQKCAQFLVVKSIQHVVS